MSSNHQLKQGFAKARQTLNDWLDLKGLDNKLPVFLKNKLPDNPRLLTLPIFILLIGFSIIFLLGVFAPSVSKKDSELFVPVVRVFEAQKQNIQLPVYGQGFVRPKHEIQLFSLVNGPVIYTSPNLVDGGRVKAGELLLQVSDHSYQQDKTKVEAQLAHAKSVQFARQSELQVRGTLRTDAGKVQLREVNAAVVAAEADVARMDDLIASTQVKAPFDGIIRHSTIQNGQMIKAGTPIASIFSTDTAEVQLAVADRQLSLLDLPNTDNPEDFPKVKLSAEFGNQQFYWQGRLIRLAGRNELNKLQYLTIEIDAPYALDSEQPGRPPLSPGYFVQAEIQGKQFENIIQLPRKALKSNQKIWLVDEHNKLKSVDAELIYKGQHHIFVHSGIENGAQVIVSNLEILANGIEVNPIALTEQTTSADMIQEEGTQP